MNARLGDENRQPLSPIQERPQALEVEDETSLDQQLRPSMTEDELGGGNKGGHRISPPPLSPHRRLLEDVHRRLSATKATLVANGWVQRVRERMQQVRARRRVRGTVASLVRRELFGPRNLPERFGLVNRLRRDSSQRVSAVVRNVAHAAKEAEERLRQERAVSVAQYYLLISAALLLAVLVVERTLRWFLRSRQLDEFSLWSQDMCSQPWNGETVLCRAVDGSWLARELIRAKLSQRGVHNCNPEEIAGGCAFEPCTSKGLSRVLVDLGEGRHRLLNRSHPAMCMRMCMR